MSKSSEKSARFRAANPEKHKASVKKWREDNPDKAWLYKSRVRARKSGLPFDKDTSDIVIPEVCPILGISIARGGTGFNPGSPSLDKIIPELGYIKGNRQVVSNRANILKRDATLDELILLGKWAESQKER